MLRPSWPPIAQVADPLFPDSRLATQPRKSGQRLFVCTHARKDTTLDNFNYGASAELYPSRRYAKSARDQYRRFKTAAEAIQYMIEDRPEAWLIGSFLEADGRRFDGNAIRALYDADGYPLDRQQAEAA
jgi:hypothetical protein